MVKITFLGTGSAGGCPRRGHTDELCVDARKRGSRSLRRRSSALLKTKGATLLIDAGPDVLTQLALVRVRKLDAVFLTHEHADATGGLHALNAWLRARGLTIPLHAFPRTVKRVHRRDFKNLIPRPITSLMEVMVHDANVASFAVRHGIKHDIPTAGFKIGGLVYASDMDGAPWTSMWVMRNARVLVLDAALWSIKSLRGHLTVTEAIALAQKLKPKKLILTQLGHTFPPHREAERMVQAYAKLKNVPFPVHLAYDGLVVRI